MTTRVLHGVVRTIRHTAASQVDAECGDGALLARFIERNDETAFDALVHRHGPMVLGVCRRVLGSQQDSEDAFQAVFLVLIRKARSISPRDLVGNWLYGVAHQTAVRVRAQNFKRLHRERPMSATPEPATGNEAGWDDLGPVLDEELSRLPDRYRAVLVLCDVEGRTRKDAARHLRCPEGSVSSRLSRARAMLAKRLARRGIALSGGALATLISEHATAGIPNALVAATRECALIALANTTKAAGLLTVGYLCGDVPQRISNIANGMLSFMAIKKSIATAVVVSVAVFGTTTGALITQHYLQAGQPVPKGEPAKATPIEQASVEDLVQQLNADQFQKREAAEKALIAIGAKAIPAVRAGTKSRDPELAQRCDRLLSLLRKEVLAQFVKAFTDDVEGKAKFEHPVWQRYVRMVGDSKASRGLFAEIVKRDDWLRDLDAAAAEPTKAGEVYREAMRQVGQRYAFNLSVFFAIPIWPCDQPREVAFLLLLGSYSGTDPKFPLSSQVAAEKQFADGETRILFARGLKLAFQGKRLETDPTRRDRSIVVEDGYGDATESGRIMLMLLGHWLEKRNCWPVVAKHLEALSAEQCKQLVPFARRAIADKAAPMLCRAAWISVLRRFGNESDAVVLTPLFEDKSGMDWPSTTRFGDGPGNLINQAQVREVAVGSAIFLRGRNPADLGFECLANQRPAKKREDEVHSTLFPVKPTGTDEERDKVLAAAIRWLVEQAKKDVPPVAPKKLPRAGEVPPELSVEFARWDKEYRHGSEEKFAELERTAEELLKKRPERENQAHILFQVAHIAAQSVITKHVERVRDYGRRMLALSQDPVERGTMHSYLASAAEVDSTVKTFAERRTLAAEELFQGYVEVLAQELPVKAPERPRLGPVGEPNDDDPNERGEARAREFAMLEAYKQAVFIEELVHRRETLLLQFRWLYRPHLKVYGRNAGGLDELRALASKKLKDVAAVEALLASVVGPDGIGRPSEIGEPKWEVVGVSEELVQIGVGGKQGIQVGEIFAINRANPKSASIGKVRVLAIDHSEATGQLLEVAQPRIQVGDAIVREGLAEFGGNVTTREDLKGYRIVISQRGLDLMVKALGIKNPPKVDFDSYLLVVGFRLAGDPNMEFDIDSTGNLGIRPVPTGPQGIMSDRVHYRVKSIERKGVKTAFGKQLKDVDIETSLSAPKE